MSRSRIAFALLTAMFLVANVRTGPVFADESAAPNPDSSTPQASGGKPGDCSDQSGSTSTSSAGKCKVKTMPYGGTMFGWSGLPYYRYGLGSCPGAKPGHKCVFYTAHDPSTPVALASYYQPLGGSDANPTRLFLNGGVGENFNPGRPTYNLAFSYLLSAVGANTSAMLTAGFVAANVQYLNGYSIGDIVKDKTRLSTQSNLIARPFIAITFFGLCIGPRSKMNGQSTCGQASSTDSGTSGTAGTSQPESGATPL